MKNYTCADCNKDTTKPVIRRRDGADVLICKECYDTVCVQAEADATKDKNAAQDKWRSNKREEERQEREYTGNANAVARQAIERVAFGGGSGTSHDKDIVKAMRQLRKAWNSNGVFLLISSGGKMVRYWDKGNRNMPNWARG